MEAWQANQGRQGPWQWSRTALACIVLTALAGLGGCTHLAASADAETRAAEAASAADNSDVRRRARIRLELAVNYLQMGQASVAMEEVRQAIATDPTYADAYHLRGLVYMGMGNLPLAEADLKRAQGMKPADPDIMHNLGWLYCQREQYEPANQLFERALAMPAYAARGKTLMSQGLCQQKAGRETDARQTLLRAYEIDPGNPLVGYNLASMMFASGEAERAQFYIRRINNGEFSNAQSLWLGVKIERTLGEFVAMRQLGDQLRRRFPDAKETQAFERGAFNE